MSDPADGAREPGDAPRLTRDPQIRGKQDHPLGETGPYAAQMQDLLDAIAAETDGWAAGSSPRGIGTHDRAGAPGGGPTGAADPRTTGQPPPGEEPP